MTLENTPAPSRRLEDAVSLEAPARPHDSPGWRSGMALAVLLLAGLALLAPLTRAHVEGRVGVLLILAAVLEVVHGFRRASPPGQRAAWHSGAITLLMGLLLVHAPLLASAALVLFLAGWFGLDGIRYLTGAARRTGEGRKTLVWLLAGLGNLLVCGVLLVLRGQAVVWTVAIAGALRIFGTASNIVLAPVFTAGDSGETVLGDLGLPDRPEMRALAGRLAEEEQTRAHVDRGWVLGFIATLFAIHLSRMGLDRTFLGIVSPGFAVLGDLFLALLLAFFLVIPLSLFWRRLTRGLERRAWEWYLGVPEGRRGWGRRLLVPMLSQRLRFAVRLRMARYSFPTALSRGLQIGLPLAAIIAATVPVWGMSWYFDTESWAAGIWNSWAEDRADTWREAMVRAVDAHEHVEDPARAFAVSPPGVPEGGDFSFIVIGDTGEGDASQHSLRSQYLEVVRREEVKFVAIASDVVYPTGAMRHYEANFWLPFMGTTKPVYAIPGNHDWYDALEGFCATFLEPNAARAAMRARVEVDHRITSTTEGRIEELIGQASRFREQYGVPTQLQKAPFFQLQTRSFALIAVDTGLARRVDPVQLAWLEGALESARGKVKMVILGHPLYAGGLYTAPDGSDFARLHDLLRRHEVEVVMAGDTHDLEHYVERLERSGRVIQHFVNGGGGAYMSLGGALAWPDQPASPTWAFYPSTADVVARVDATAPRWKKPAWWWTRRFRGWPFSAEWLSAAFDVNVAPFYQSFIEVRVEPSARRVRFLPHGVRGRLRWKDMQTSPGALPAGATPDTLVEWVVAMPE